MGLLITATRSDCVRRGVCLYSSRRYELPSLVVYLTWYISIAICRFPAKGLLVVFDFRRRLG